MSIFQKMTTHRYLRLIFNCSSGPSIGEKHPEETYASAQEGLHRGVETGQLKNEPLIQDRI